MVNRGAKYIVFDPEATGPTVYWLDVWDETLDDVWDSGHGEIVDIQASPPRRYRGQGKWDPVTTWIQV
jgi:hypothetical protein